jgi:hypothetical protein
MSDEKITETSQTPTINRKKHQTKIPASAHHRPPPRLYGPPSSSTTLHEVEPLLVSPELFAD